MDQDSLLLKLRAFVSETFGFELDDSKLEQFRKLLALLNEWNNKINLVSFKSEEEVIFRHFADSLSPLKYLDCNASLKLCDIGAGAGFPGLPLKIALPQIHITLVESIGKKCMFMREAANALMFESIEILNSRVEDIAFKPQIRESFDAVVSRAVAQLPVNLELAAPLVKLGGSAYIFKTADNDECAGIAPAAELLGCALTDKYDYKLPQNERVYRLLKFDKINKTPGKYPRKPAIIAKKPLVD